MSHILRLKNEQLSYVLYLRVNCPFFKCLRTLAFKLSLKFESELFLTVHVVKHLDV